MRLRRISRNWQCISSPKSVSIPLTCKFETMLLFTSSTLHGNKHGYPPFERNVKPREKNVRGKINKYRLSQIKGHVLVLQLGKYPAYGNRKHQNEKWRKDKPPSPIIYLMNHIPHSQHRITEHSHTTADASQLNMLKGIGIR